MNRRETYALVLGRAAARVSRGWTQGAYSRHPDGRALQSIGIRAETVDLFGALVHTAKEYDLTDSDVETLRYLVTAELPEPFRRDLSFGVERFNDHPLTTAFDVARVLRAAKETHACAGLSGSFPVDIAA